MTDLAKGQIERLGLLAEECGEVLQQVGKILRFGQICKLGEKVYDNKSKLEAELVDLLTIIELMDDYGDIVIDNLEIKKQQKYESMRPFLIHTHLSL